MKRSITFSGHFIVDGQKKACESSLLWSATAEGFTLEGDAVDKDGETYLVTGTCQNAAPYRVAVQWTSVLTQTTLAGEGFKEKDSFNIFGKLGAGQFSLREDSSSGLRNKIVGRLLAELVEMGFERAAVEEALSRGELNKAKRKMRIAVEALTHRIIRGSWWRR